MIVANTFNLFEVGSLFNLIFADLKYLHVAYCSFYGVKHQHYHKQ